jgi:hypothetical protein
MSIITILLFFVYTYGLGYTATYFLKNSDNFFERSLMRIGIGLGVLPFLLVLFNLFHIPIDWKIVLIVSLMIPLFSLVSGLRKGFKIPSIKLNKSNLYFLIVLLIFFLTLFMYVKGSFIYPYLEDDDPWAHAAGIKYISIEKNANPNIKFMYLAPYPPGYDGLMAILHQTSLSLMWTIKFFNAFIISLGIIFFYFFTKSFMHNKNKALIATIILAMIPCYLSHFIWAHSLVVTLLIVALYCLTMIDKDKRWIYPSMLVIAGICLSQPSQSIKFFFIFMGYFIIKSLYSKTFLVKDFLAIIFGYSLSLFWWANNWGGLFAKQLRGRPKLTPSNGGFFTNFFETVQRAFPYDGGTATRPYTFSDFFIAKSQNMINNPLGVGIVLSLIALFSLLMIFLTYKSMKKEKKIWIMTSIFWLVFTFFGINSMTFHLPIGFYAFRFWMLFAIPVSILAAEGFWFIASFFRQFRIPKIATILLLIFLIFLTSAQQKYAVNTAMWGPGAFWTSMEEIQGYTWLKTLPVNTKVFAYSGDEVVIGFDKFSCLWCDEVIEFRKDLLYKNSSELYSWLKKQRYEYLIVDGMSYRNLGEIYGENKTNEILPQRFEEIGSFEKFQVAHQTKGMVIFRIF